MTTSFIESQIEADQLRARIDQLTDENTALRDLASPAAGSLELQAENILLRREIEMLTDLLPHLVAYDGPLPETLEAFSALPEPHRQQVAAANGEHVQKLLEVEQLMQLAAESDRREDRRRGELEGLPVASADEFAALDEHERAELAMTLTGPQRLAMLGEAPPEPDQQAYLKRREAELAAENARLKGRGPASRGQIESVRENTELRRQVEHLRGRLPDADLGPDSEATGYLTIHQVASRLNTTTEQAVKMLAKVPTRLDGNGVQVVAADRFEQFVLDTATGRNPSHFL